MSGFSTGLDVENSSYFFEVVLGLLGGDFAIELEIRFGSDQEEDGLFVGILSGFPDPPLEVAEAVFAIDGEGEEDAADAFVEGSHDGPEGFLSGLDGEDGTVSQIWSLTWSF